MPWGQQRDTHYCSGGRLDGVIVTCVPAQQPSCSHANSERPFARHTKHDERNGEDDSERSERYEHQHFQSAEDGEHKQFSEKSTHASLHLRM